MSQINDYPVLIDITNRRVIRDTKGNLPINLARLVQGDKYRLTISAVRPHPQATSTRLWEYVALPDTLHAAVVVPGSAPTQGTFTLTFGGDTTSALDFDASSSDVQTALNALASITSAGGVVVSGGDGGPFQVTFNNAGARAAITADAGALYPLSQINIYTAVDGDGSTAEIQIVAIERQPLALCESWSALPSGSVTITTVQEGASGVPEIQTAEIPSEAYGGFFTLTFGGQTTAPIAYDATAADVQTALEALSTIASGDVVVTGDSPRWTVSFAGNLTGSQPAMTGAGGGLSMPIGKVGTLNLSTAGIEQLVAGAASAEADFEVQALYDDTEPSTILQADVTVLNDGIPNSPATGTGLPTYYTQSAADALFALLGEIADSGLTVAGEGVLARLSAGSGALARVAPASHVADVAADASEAHALNATFSDTEVEAALNALGAKVNALSTALNTVLANLEARAIHASS